jgi:anti-sigma factor RsiW
MTDPKIPVTEDELHAYVDNELPAERRGDVEAWLATHPDCAERVRAWREMAEELHARYNHIADETVPRRLEIERLVQRPRKWMYGAVAATLAAFICGTGAGWLVRGVSATPSAIETLTSDALDAHRLYVVEVRHPVEVPGSERDHLQTWLTKRCGWEVRAPKLDTSGLKLVGGRLLPGRRRSLCMRVLPASVTRFTPLVRRPDRHRCATPQPKIPARCTGRRTTSAMCLAGRQTRRGSIRWRALSTTKPRRAARKGRRNRLVQIRTLRIWNWNMGASKYRSRYSREIVARSIRRSTQAASTGVGTALVPQIEAAPPFYSISSLFDHAGYERSLRGL